VDKRISRDSVEALRVEVNHTTIAGAAADPTGYPVAIAVLPGGDADPEPSDWLDATWAQGPRSKVAIALVGPLAPGRYGVWVKVTADPEVPVMRADWTLLVY
jgi:hypothetical protein